LGINGIVTTIPEPAASSFWQSNIENGLLLRTQNPQGLLFQETETLQASDEYHGAPQENDPETKEGRYQKSPGAVYEPQTPSNVFAALKIDSQGGLKSLQVGFRATKESLSFPSCYSQFT
jgi:hypothetical protein